MYSLAAHCLLSWVCAHVRTVPLFENDTIIQQPVNLQTIVSRYTEKATGFMSQAVKDSKPFFLYMAYDEVHVPLFASDEFTGVSQRGLFGDAGTIGKKEARIGGRTAW